MGSLIVYSPEKIDELIDASVVGATIVEGHLILELRNGTSVDAGEILDGVPDASETVKGVVELASDAEALAGTSSAVAVTPLGLKGVADTKQAADSDLTTFAGLTKTNDNVLQVKSGAWTGRTMAQLATDLAATGELPDVLLHNGTSYVDADTMKIYIGPTDPGSVPNGSIWYDTTGA